MGRDAQEKRKVDPYHLLFRGGQFYLIGHSHERDDVRVFRLSRIHGKVGYSSKAEHDFPPPEDFDPRVYATRADWQLGETVGTARVWISDRIDWLVQRHFGHAGTVIPAAEVDDAPDDGVVFETDYGESRQVVSWALGLGERARVLGPPELAEEAAERVRLIVERHAEPLEPAHARSAGARQVEPSRRRRLQRPRRGGDPAGALRPPRHARRDPDRRRAPGRAPGDRRSLRAPPDHRDRSCARTSTC